jgi:glycogen debranching enzyme
MLHLPPLYYGTVDATTLWVQLLHDAWRWGMAESEVEDLLPHLDAALGWLARSVANAPDGLLRYRDTSGHGLANQGWKDSDDSMRRRDGSLAPTPIALVEAQAYAVSAARKAAALLDHFGRGGGPSWRSWADELGERIRSRFWVDGPDGCYLAMAIDAAGHPVDGVGSNMGHVLGTGALRPDEAAAVVSTLTGPTMFGRFGIHTLSKDNPGYNPLGYHTGSVWAHDTAICAVGMAAEGHQVASGQVVRSLLEAAAAFDYRLPELYAGEAALGRPAPYPASCRPQAWAAAAAAAAVTALLGLEVDIPARTLRLRPVRPSPVGRLVVSGVRFGAADITVRVDADGTPHVDGLPPGVLLTIL